MTTTSKTTEDATTAFHETIAQMQKMGLDSMTWMGSDWAERMADLGSEMLNFMAERVQEDVEFPIAHSVSRSTADQLGAWWNEERGFMQPTQFLMRGDGTIIQSTYSDGPLGRILAEDACRLVAFLSSK